MGFIWYSKFLPVQSSESNTLRRMLFFLYVSGKAVWFCHSICIVHLRDMLAAFLLDSLNVSPLHWVFTPSWPSWNHCLVLLIGHGNENGKSFSPRISVKCLCPSKRLLASLKWLFPCSKRSARGSVTFTFQSEIYVGSS